MNTMLNVTTFGEYLKRFPSFAHPLSQKIDYIIHRAVSRTARIYVIVIAGIDSFLRRAVFSTYGPIIYSGLCLKCHRHLAL